MECDDESSEDEEDGADDMLAEDEIDAAAATARGGSPEIHWGANSEYSFEQFFD